MQRSRRTGQSLALAYLDIDHFKRINDTCGHGIGDQVLIEFACRLEQCVRVTDTVARLAGDEFVIIFKHLATPAELEVLGQKIMEAMQREFRVRRCLAGRHDERWHRIRCGHVKRLGYMESSDRALYDAKHAGRKRYAIREIESHGA